MVENIGGGGAAMAATELTSLALPAALVEYLRGNDRSHVLTQDIAVDYGWWNQRLANYGLPGGPIAGDNGLTLTRADVFAVGIDDPHRLLWFALAWGAGNRRRLCDKRMRAVASLGDAGRNVLAAAAGAAGSDPVGAFELLAPGGKPAIPYLGAAFFTKYLYFASRSEFGKPSAYILDSRVAASLSREGWRSLVPSGGWSSGTYQRYVELINRWSAIASDTLGRDVIGDEIELWLFRSIR